MRRALPLLVSALLLGFVLADAATLRVPEDYPAIQTAIDAAAPGDRVFIAAGWYWENLEIDKPIILEGEDRGVVLQPVRGQEEEGSIISIHEPGGHVAVKGLVLANRHTGVTASLKEGGNVELERCTILECTVGALCVLGRVSFRDCVFSGNSSIGLFLGALQASIERCWISGSTRGIALMSHVSVSVVDSCIVDSSRGISTMISACEGEDWPAEYRGVITGHGNRIVVSEKPLCPEPGISLWPDGFLDLEGSRQISEAQSVLNAASSRMYSDPAEARVQYERACSLFADLDCPLLRATALQELAFVLYGDYLSLEARAVAKESQMLFLEHGDVRGAAAALGTEGRILRTLRLSADAIEAMEAGLEIFSQLTGHVYGESQIEKDLGTCYLEAGEAALAIPHFRQAMAGFIELDEPSEAASVGLVLGLAHSDAGAFEDALQVLRESLAIYEAAEDVSGVFAAHWNLAIAYQAANYLDEAMMEHQLALDALPSDAGEVNRIAVLLSYGDLLEGAGQAAQAEAVFQSIAQLLAEHTEEEEEQLGAALWTMYHSLGQAQVRAFRLDAALASFTRAITHVERIRGQLAEEAQRLQFQQSADRLYADMIALLLELGSSSETFPYAERCRARTFLDLVGSGPTGPLADIAEEGICSGAVDAAVIESDLAEVIAALPANAAAAEYFVTGETTYLWLVRDGSVNAPIRIEIGEADLRQRILAFRATLETSTTGLSDLPEEVTLTVSRDLYDLLVGPIEDQLEGIEHLVLVPSGPLYYLPFCALLDCPGCEGADLLGGQFLVERFSLSYMPSLTTLKYAWASADEVRDDPLFLALADPDSQDAEIPRLPEAEDEATAAAGLFDPSEVYVDEEATEDVMTARGGEADQILLSTHGSFNPVNPMFSYLLLSPTQESDGRLYTHEIFGLDLHTDLVTLSACETLLPSLEDAKDQLRALRDAGEEQDVELTEELLEALTAGDEIVGLTRAFLYAGTPSVLSTLWSVVSQTTEPLMVAFYEYLQQGFDKAEALRQAQRDVMKMYPHPRYWAAFELMGDWR